MQQAIERAIALGKAGQFEDGLTQLESLPPGAFGFGGQGVLRGGILAQGALQKDNMPGSLSRPRGGGAWLSTGTRIASPACGPVADVRRKALNYLGGTYFDDVVEGVAHVEPGQEARILELFAAHEEVALFLTPTSTPPQSEPRSTKTWLGPTANGLKPRGTRRTLKAWCRNNRPWRSPKDMTDVQPGGEHLQPWGGPNQRHGREHHAP